MRLRVPASLVFVAFVVVGCATRNGPHVRFASATSEQIRAASATGREVWFDFETGDVVPLQFALLGVAESATQAPIRLIARRPFSVVVFPDGTTYFSFDRSSLTHGTLAARWALALDADDRGPHAGILMMIGREQDLPAELRR